MLPKAAQIAWDIETAEGGEIVDYPTMVSAASDDWCYVAIGEENIRSLLTELANSSAELITWNGWQFDTRVVRKWGIPMPLGSDGMVLSYLVDETAPQGLESQAMQRLGLGGWKHGDWKTFDPTTEEAANYAARDASITLRLYRHLRNRLGDRAKLADIILKPAFVALAAMSERGIYIDPVAVAREKQNAESVLSSSLARILELTGSEEFNPGSTKQVGEYLGALGVDLPFTATGKPDTSVKVLKELGLPVTRAILEYRGAKKTLGTYCENYEKLIAADGRVHPEYKITRTLTGRSSAVNQNVQNLPREYKDFFGAPNGEVFCEADWSAIEFRVAAWVAQEPTILANFSKDPNWDPHRFFAARFYDIEETKVTKEQRQVAKSANFGLLYLGNGHTLVDHAKGLGITLSEPVADALYRQWHATFPGMRKLYKETKDEILRTSESRTATGFVRHFGDISIMPPHMRSEALRQGVNVKVQGFAAHIAYVAMAKLHELGMPLTGFIHDAFLFEFKNEEELHKFLPTIEDVMCNYPREFFEKHFNFTLDVPLTVESKWHIG